jgi:hypothetical protein
MVSFIESEGITEEKSSKEGAPMVKQTIGDDSFGWQRGSSLARVIMESKEDTGKPV